MSGDDTWEVYAIQYAHRADRHRYETFITNAWTDPLHDTLQPISYYVWAIVNRERAFVVDTGFGASELGRRRRESGDRWQPRLICSPAEGLARIGVDAAKVRDVVVTHLHFDHAGTLDEFPAARFHLQELEMRYATGPHMAHAFFNGAYSVGHVTRMVEHVYEGRVAFHSGDAELAPGVTLHLIGGHTLGIQSVRVRTRRGWGGARERREPLLRQRRGERAVSDRPRRGGHARGVHEAPGPRDLPRTTSFRGMTRRSWNATRRRAPRRTGWSPRLDADGAG